MLLVEMPRFDAMTFVEDSFLGRFAQDGSGQSPSPYAKLVKLGPFSPRRCCFHGQSIPFNFS